jgi:hypothetical protein
MSGEPLRWAICSEELGPLDYYSTREAAELALSYENPNPQITVKQVPAEWSSPNYRPEHWPPHN